MTASPIILTEHARDETLSPLLVNYWTLTHDGREPALHFVPPDGCTHLAFNGAQGVIIGPHVRPLRPPLEPGDRWFGIRFRPGAARRCLPLQPALRLRNQILSLDTLPPGLHCQLQSAIASADLVHACRVADSQLHSCLDRIGNMDSRVATTVDRILASGGRVKVSELARSAGCSERQLRRRFTAAVDLSPKEFASAWRLRLCVLATLQPAPDWAALAAQLGFADQAHLIREFRRWTSCQTGTSVQNVLTVVPPGEGVSNGSWATANVKISSPASGP